MKRFKLTVLTEPVSAAGFVPKLKSFVRPLKYFLQGKKSPGKKKYGGHYAVTRSLIEGLQKTGVDFNYNPVNENDIAENVIVLAGADTLRKAIQLKNEGKIKKLFAGPNVCESPNDENGLLTDKEVDVCIVPSQWVGDLYVEEKKELEGRIKIWHAGIDTNYWQPLSKKKVADVVVYWKTEEEEFCKAIEAIIGQYSYNPVRIKYGSYNLKKYKEVLDNAVFAVFISRSESQGIALAEAWSMNVPTFTWEPVESIIIKKKYKNSTACPYLNEEAGLKWSSLNELKNFVENTANAVLSFEPRNYALRSFSDELCAAGLVNKFQLV
jgi:hypothetical protein